MNIVQIGANNGNDHVYDFVEKNASKIKKLILVEPMPQLIPPLQWKYSKILSNVEYENIVISGTESAEPLKFYYDMNSSFETSTLDRNHLVGLGCPEKKIGTMLVPSLTFNQLMRKHNITELDALYIDAEGHDYHIIKSIDFKKYKVKMIYFESDHTDGTNKVTKNMEDLMNYFNDNNYDFKWGRPNASATLKNISN